MKRSFVLTAEAKSDLREILLDIAEDSPDTAERLRVEFYEGLKALGRSPVLATTTMNSSGEISFLELLLLCGRIRLGSQAHTDDQCRSRGKGTYRDL